MPRSPTEVLLEVNPVADTSVVTWGVRVGVHGQVARMQSDTRLTRGAQVVCRTVRGVEVGVVLNRLANSHRSAERGEQDFDGQILRVMAPEDQLLWNHLKALADEAFDACQSRLAQQQLPDQLLEVEPLLDGQTLYFHFLNTVSPATSAHVDQLAEIFQQTVASSSFAQQVAAGCGPGCGTDAARGCGSACSVCSVRSQCGTKRI